MCSGFTADKMIESVGVRPGIQCEPNMNLMSSQARNLVNLMCNGQ